MWVKQEGHKNRAYDRERDERLLLDDVFVKLLADVMWGQETVG